MEDDKNARRIKSIIVNGDTKEDCSDIAEGFSEYFAGVARSLDAAIPQTELSPVSYVSVNRASSLFINPVSPEEISRIILDLKNTSANISEVPVKVLKKVHSLLADTVAKLVNKSFCSGIFPDALKVAKIVPVFKSGNSIYFKL